MSVVNRPEFYSLGTSYDNKSLDMIQNIPSQLDHNAYPIILSDAEKLSIQFDHVCDVIGKKCLLPTKAAGLKDEDLSPTLKKVNNAYEVAMADYEDTLLMAMRQDFKNIDELNKKLESQLDTRNYTWEYTTYGFWYFILGAIPFYYVGVAMDDKKDKLNELKTREIRREQCASRRQWLTRLDTFEKIRKTDLRNTLEARVVTIIGTLKELGNDEYDISLVKELKNIKAVYQSEFPNEGKMLIEHVDVAEYLKKFDTNLKKIKED